MGKGNSTGKQIVQSEVSNANNTLATGPSSTVNPLLQARTTAAFGNLDKIDAGDFGSLPLVQAVNLAAQKERAYTPKPMGDAALSASEAGGGGGYADQQEAYRKRRIDDNVANIMPEAVAAERQYNTSVAFPGTQALDQFDLQKAATYGSLAGQGNALYGTQQANSFSSNLARSFGAGLGQNLSGSDAYITPWG